MRKREIEKLLVQAIADALGVEADAANKTSRIAAPRIGKPTTGSHQDRAAA